MGEGANRGITQIGSTSIVRNLWSIINGIIDQVASKIPYTGGYSGNTDATGYVIITHGLGFTPTRVFITSRYVLNNTTNANMVIGVDQVGSTTFRVRMGQWRTAPVGSTAFYIDIPSAATPTVFDWAAYR